MLQPQIVEKPRMLFVGLEASFNHALSPDTTNFEVIPPLWGKFIPRAETVPHRVGQAMYGIIYGRPAEERSHPDELQYIAGVAVSRDSDAPNGMVAHAVEPCTFAVFMHRGPIQNIGETCREIYREWLPQSDYEHAGIVDIELYDERFCGDSDDSEFEYWISVKPKTRSVD